MHPFAVSAAHCKWGTARGNWGAAGRELQIALAASLPFSQRVQMGTPPSSITFSHMYILYLWGISSRCPTVYIIFSRDKLSRRFVGMHKTSPMWHRSPLSSQPSRWNSAFTHRKKGNIMGRNNLSIAMETRRVEELTFFFPFSHFASFQGLFLCVVKCCCV